MAFSNCVSFSGVEAGMSDAAIQSGGIQGAAKLTFYMKKSIFDTQ